MDLNERRSKRTNLVWSIELSVLPNNSAKNINYKISQKSMTSKTDYVTSFDPRRHTSGVSAGQIMPHCVLCSCLGLASLPSLPIGEFRRLRWDKVEANVSLFNTWEINIMYQSNKEFML